MCKENKFKKISEGYCPCCGSSNVTHGIATIEDTVVSYPCECADCGANLTISRRGKDGPACFYCSSYKNKKTCSKHHISEKK